MRRRSTQITYALTTERVVLTTFISIAGLMFLYIYFIQSAIHAAASRERMVRVMSSLATEVGELENDAIALRGELSESRARELGFVEVQETIYVSGSPHLGAVNTVGSIRE